MHSISQKKIVLLSTLILIISPSLIQGNASANSLSQSKVSSFSANSTPISYLSIQRRINDTIVEVNQSVFIELILTNIGNNPIYNIKLNESLIQKPNIITKSLINPMLFSSFEPNEVRIISYSITALSVMNITLIPTVATYQQVNNPNATIYTSYSDTNVIVVKPKVISQNEENLKYLLILTVIALIYVIISIVRSIFKLKRKSNQLS